MDISDAILSSTIEGNHRYGDIFTGARKIIPMSREKFNDHLKQLVEDKYVIRTDKGKQEITYEINQDVFNIIQGFHKENEKEDQEEYRKMLNSDIDFSVVPITERDEMIKHFDELLHIVLIQQNLATLIIHDLHQGDKVVKEKAVEGRNNNDITIDLILKLIKKINPDIGESYSTFTFNMLAKEHKSILNQYILTIIENSGKRHKEEINKF